MHQAALILWMASNAICIQTNPLLGDHVPHVVAMVVLVVVVVVAVVVIVVVCQVLAMVAVLVWLAPLVGLWPASPMIWAGLLGYSLLSGIGLYSCRQRVTRLAV